MGWSIFVNWRGAEDHQQGQHPGFYNDDHAWAEWVCAALQDREAKAILQRLELMPLLVGAAEGMKPVWPEMVMEAAVNLRILVAARDPSIARLVDLYAPQCIDPENPHECMVQDLQDVEAIARYAREQGAQEMVLEYTR